ncbi:uncharacterized protein LOC123302859 [Chrysoperla carnea]|uniref:uncharacterized protein LOC123302859 n=1 Tax=Chrysoperla carnea TaxID=189513 RepID=UPI001D089F82|nr:uncharacterized protein LOC123302859 [Chrysoperla carnea]
MAEQLKRKLRIFEAKKQTLFQRLQRLYDISKDLSDPNVLNNFKISYMSLDETRSQLLEIVEKINTISLELDNASIPNFQILDTIEELCGHIKMVKYSISKEKSEIKTNNTEIIESVKTKKVLPKLPKIDIIKFSGDPQTWPVFYQTFKTLIHDNPDIDESCKIHYLLSKLDGKAAIICSGIQPIAENYSIIWKILVDKYQDKRFLANNYLKQILDFKSIQVESTSALNNFIERFDTSVSALKQLNIADLADLILVSIALSKLDNSTRKLFEMSIKEVELPTYQQLSEFIRIQAKVLSRVSNTGGHMTKFSNPSCSSSKSTHAFTSINATNSNCPVCQKQPHLVYTCPKFISLTPSERYNLSKEKSLCLNCLSNKHHIAKCKSTNSCSKCKVRHHTLLHFEKSLTSGENTAPSLSCSSQQDESSFVDKETTKECFTVQTPVLKQNYTTLLSTAVVKVCLPNGKSNSIRILLDSASQGDFLTENCCRRLGLVINRIHASVVGIGANPHYVRGQVQNIAISSRFNSQIQCVINAWVVDKITDKLPTAHVNTKHLDYLRELPLADSEFDKCREVDGILGAQWFPKLIGIGKVSAAPDLPFGLQTSLGYVIMGKTPILDDLNLCQSFCTLIDPPIEQIVEKFFEIEEVPMGKIDSPENIECEKHFTKTHIRDFTGRYSVALPFKEDPSNLGDSYSSALKRFISLERKLDASPQLRKQYNDAFNDYLIQGHMRKLVDNCISDRSGYYLPHHPVFKVDSTTTPLRIVFDASCKTNSSLSLNDVLHTGPKLQTDVLGMFLNFRLNQIAFTADIRQMYRQINLCQEHTRFQRVLYRFESSENIETYELTTLAFGVKPSPFLALRVVRQLAMDEAIKYPQATEIVLRDMYIDDLVSSTVNLEIAKDLCAQLVKVFEAGGFSLVKWSSNSKELLTQLPKTQSTTNLIDFDSNYLKVLGMKWSTSSDHLLFSVTGLNKNCNKRNILSTIARIFDPLGLLGPVTLYAKLFIRKLWSIKIGWDETPPDYLLNQWMKFQIELPLLERFSIPRHLGRFENSILTLIGFADACETSYACTVYLRSVSNQNKSIKTVLICAKSKVSPLKVETLARLELCACVMLAKLMSFVLNTFFDRCRITKIFAFTDSMVALHWINASPHRWKTFIANRVVKIQDYLPTNVWYHVEGLNNAADSISRGMTPEKFLEVQTDWIFGPSWLQLDEEYWPIKSFVDLENVSNVPEEKIVSCPGTVQPPDHPLYTLIQKHSSWSKLLRSTVIVFRFIKKLPITKDFSLKDLEFAEQALIRVVQNIHFKDDILALKNNRICSNRLKNLSPFLENDILRVGGRLKHASIPYAHQHPVLLPKKDHFSFWKRWKEEYLSTLQVRQKWNTPACPVQIGQLVILKQDNLPPLHWPMGIIEKVYPGTDEKYKAYTEFMDEYISLYHMSKATNSSSYIIPHHCVTKDTSTSTKLRVVFNASDPGYNKISLNSLLLAGPKLQNDISDILYSFRFNAIALCSDIRQMYRQILVRPEDRTYQHIFYRPSTESDVVEFELNTVTYGLVPSAFLAQRCLKQLVIDEGNHYPLASQAFLHNTYVDDIITGASSPEQAKTLLIQLQTLMSRGETDEGAKLVQNMKSSDTQEKPSNPENMDTFDQPGCLKDNSKNDTIETFFNKTKQDDADSQASKDNEKQQEKPKKERPPPIKYKAKGYKPTLG